MANPTDTLIAVALKSAIQPILQDLAGDYARIEIAPKELETLGRIIVLDLNSNGTIAQYKPTASIRNPNKNPGTLIGSTMIGGVYVRAFLCRAWCGEHSIRVYCSIPGKNSIEA